MMQYCPFGELSKVYSKVQLPTSLANLCSLYQYEPQLAGFVNSLVSRLDGIGLKKMQCTENDK
jgi:hypothetical protein